MRNHLDALDEFQSVETVIDIWLTFNIHAAENYEYAEHPIMEILLSHIKIRVNNEILLNY